MLIEACLMGTNGGVNLNLVYYVAEPNTFATIYTWDLQRTGTSKGWCLAALVHHWLIFFQLSLPRRKPCKQLMSIS